jgi:hypothetical protein
MAAVLTGLALSAGEITASAQATGTTLMPTRPARWEVSGGGLFVGGYDLGNSDADLTPNTGGSGPFTLFTTDNQVRPAFGLLARVGFIVTPSLVIEGGMRFARPVYEVRASDDTENAPDTTIEETLSQYVFDASVVWSLGSNDRRVVPFVFAGAGYLRELHEEASLVDEGVEYHAGGGLRWWFAPRLGLRAEGGISIRDGGFDFEDGPRVVPVVSGSVVFRF